MECPGGLRRHRLVGQQAFIGVGAYATIYLTHAGIDGYLAMVLAILITAVIAFAMSFFVLRLRGGEFAIAMWVVAEVFRQLVSFDTSVGGGTGISLTALSATARTTNGVHLLVGAGRRRRRTRGLFVLLRLGTARRSRPSGTMRRPPHRSAFASCPTSA